MPHSAFLSGCKCPSNPTPGRCRARGVRDLWLHCSWLYIPEKPLALLRVAIVPFRLQEKHSLFLRKEANSKYCDDR